MTKKTIFKVVLTGAVIGLIMASGLALIKIKLHGRFPAGTSVAGIELSQKTLEEGITLGNWLIIDENGRRQAIRVS